MVLSLFERTIARRYLLPGRNEAFIALVAGISVGVVMLSVAMLVIVMSVMNGFRAELLDKIVDQGMLPANKLLLLVFADLDVELPQLLANHIPVLFLRLLLGQLLQVVDLGVEREWLRRLCDDGLSHLQHELANIEGVLQELPMLPMELDPLLLYFHFIALIVLDVPAVEHPKVQLNIKVKRHFCYL